MKLNWTAIGETFFGSKWRTFGSLIGIVIVLGLLAWAGNGINNYFFNRGVKKDKAIQQQLKEISNTEGDIANLQQKKAQQATNVAVDTQAYLDAQNASEQARQETNRALANMQNAINANHSIDVTAADLEKRLRELQ